MAGFEAVTDSRCFAADNRNLAGVRMACLARRGDTDAAAAYYVKSGLNPAYRFGDAT
jgi:hypothetical protein